MSGKTGKKKRVFYCMGCHTKTKANENPMVATDDGPRCPKCLSQNNKDEKADHRFVGKMIRETEKAILFRGISEDVYIGSQWWPKSQAHCEIGSVGPADVLVASAWVVSQKVG